MAAIKDVTPEQARALLDQGYVYVDVRSEPEFEQGHVPGALNVPLLHLTERGMQENPEFLSVMSGAFRTDEKLVIGCKAGARSRRAAELLLEAGFTELADLLGGFVEGKDTFGRKLPGWSQKGLPVEAGKPEGQSYADVKQRTPK